MKLYTYDNFIKPNKKTVVALGNFDGVHKGHQQLIKLAVSKAKEKGLLSFAYIFERHPENVLSGRIVTPEITSNVIKAKYMEEMGLDCLFFDRFDAKTASLEPESFGKSILYNKLNAAAVVCGFHYHFGSGGSGDVGLLKELCSKFNIEVYVLPPVTQNHIVISSSIIRSLIVEGKMEEAESFMGHPYVLRAEITFGKKLGRTMGFPTVNQFFDDRGIIPLHGVYVTTVKVQDKVYGGVTNVGIRPTVDRGRINAETHLLDFEGDLYGEIAEVSFLHRLRGEIKFSDLNHLKAQIDKDVSAARAYLSCQKQI